MDTFNIPLPPDDPKGPADEAAPPVIPFTPEKRTAPAPYASPAKPLSRAEIIWDRFGEILIGVVFGVAVGATGMYLYYERQMDALIFARPTAIRRAYWRLQKHDMESSKKPQAAKPAAKPAPQPPPAEKSKSKDKPAVKKPWLRL